MLHFSRLFLFVILLPSMVLAIMAVNLAREERVLVEHQQTVLYQTITDSLSANISRELDTIRLEFKTNALPLMDTLYPADYSQFDAKLHQRWPLAQVGFLINSSGNLLSPSPSEDLTTDTFLNETRSFLNNSENANVYLSKNAFSNSIQQEVNQSIRLVQPQRLPAANAMNFSMSVPSESDFRRSLGSDTSGWIARFLNNHLRLLVWARRAPESDLIFGAQVDLPQLQARLGQVVVPSPPAASYLSSAQANSDTGYCAAILDDRGEPIAKSIPGFTAEWKRPFVSTEIGDVLPHWEAALYLTHPDQINRSARTLQLILCIVIFVMFVAIAIGGALIATDIRRQMFLAQQKTDFVSNVSHELKTPLTSIRMFSELLAEGRVTDPDRQLTYLKIISAEAARLTRLINNILDFSRPERSIDPKHFIEMSLIPLIQEVSEMNQPHLESNGIHLATDWPSDLEQEGILIHANPDSISQILLNLISNAEKYGGSEIVIRVEKGTGPENQNNAFVHVMDRGPGIPPGDEERIFAPFVRLHDSLASGIPGTGLGLTLARRLARENSGDLSYTTRSGGGSCFTLKIPISKESNESRNQESVKSKKEKSL